MVQSKAILKFACLAGKERTVFRTGYSMLLDFGGESMKSAVLEAEDFLPGEEVVATLHMTDFNYISETKLFKIYSGPTVVGHGFLLVDKD